MAVRRNNNDERQLDLFGAKGTTHDNTIDTIRTDGRETLAGALPQDGARTGGLGTPASDAPGSGGEDQGRNAGVAH